MYKAQDIAAIIGADSKGDVTEHEFQVLLTDSRQLTEPANTLFVALVTDRNDAHQYIYALIQKGVKLFLVNYIPENCVGIEGICFLITANTKKALQTLAAYHRAQYSIPVIGITGSNGKTIVKEWLYQMLYADKNIVRNPKSYNSQLGVPLSVWQITVSNNLGLFEAGISQRGEMERLEAIIQPTIGVMTHIGSAHDEGFESDSEKVQEKLKLFKNCKLLIHNYDQLLPYKTDLPQTTCFTWSRSFNQADLYVFTETVISKSYYLRAKFKGEEIECLVPFTDKASVENAIICWATMLAMGYKPAEVDKRIERLTRVSMRLELKNGVNDCSIIDDSYNSDIQSLEIALNFLNQQNQHQKNTVILSDIFQSGLPEEELYNQVAQLIKAQQVDKFIGVGEALIKYQELFDVTEKHFYADTIALLNNLNTHNFKDETILIKGSRTFEFERVSRALTQKAHETVMEINLNAMVHNLNYYRSKLQPGVKTMAMVKAFSYGSGTFELANVLQYNKVDYLAVAYIDEGVALRQTGINLPIMVLNAEPSAFDKLIKHNLEPVIYSFGLFDEFIKYVQHRDILNYPIHLKIDTGMHRLGFELVDIDMLGDLLEQNKFMRVLSVFSHLAASEAEAHDDFTLGQITSFKTAFTTIEDALGYPVIKHVLNSSGITRWPGAQFDMVRLGIGLYGVDAAIADDNPLQPIASLKTNISQIKKIAPGDTVGYSRKGEMPKGGKIATVRIGYADGYIRAFGNGVGKMMINGIVVPTIGNISMDMTMLDVSEVVNVDEGDEVVVFNDQLKVEDMAAQINTIPYEILTNISQRVKRVYFYE